jgi:hypothetical protein
MASRVTARKLCISCRKPFAPPSDRPRARKCDDCYYLPMGQPTGYDPRDDYRK